jgi:chromosome segregation ATPase
MSISQEEAAQIRTEQTFLKEQVSELVNALKSNTERVGEMIAEMRERDVRDEYREKEFEELKTAIHDTNSKIDSYIKSKEPIVEWAKRRKEFYDGLVSSITSTWGKIVAAAILIGVAYAVGLDISKLIK